MDHIGTAVRTQTSRIRVLAEGGERVAERVRADAPRAGAPSGVAK